MNKSFILFGLAFACALSVVVYSCTDSLDGTTYFTTEELTLMETLESDFDSYSEYIAILEKTGYDGALKSYGTYTCFVPTNSAVDAYILERWGVNSVSELTTDEQMEALETIVRFHTLPTKEWTSSFEEGRLDDTTFSGDYLTTSFLSGGGIANVLINREAELVNYDVEADNGIIHSLDALLDPFVDGVATVLEEAGKHTIFIEALKQTGLYDSINNLSTKFTILAESDSVFALSGIYSFDELVASKSPDDDDYENEDNDLNEFIGYHIIEGFYYTSDFADGYLSTLAEGEALDVEKTDEELKFNEDDEGVYLSLVTSDSNYPAKNGVYHTVDTIMDIYTPSASYLIWDFVNESTEYSSGAWVKGTKYTQDAFSDIYWYPEDETCRYLRASSAPTYNYTTFDMSASLVYIEFTTPILPVGQYDFFVCAKRGSGRGVFQFYWDDEPIGSIYDLTTSASDIEFPDSTAMESYGWRHGLKWITDSSGNTQYDSESFFRFHITDELLCSEQKEHVIKMVRLDSGGCPIDYFEWIPIEQ
jgi:uncharacterized surface protein with fasciclin (FAS1) repeats